MRLRFLREGLDSLDALLRARGAHLAVRFGDPVEVVARAAAEIGADRVVATRERSPFGVARDRAVAEALPAVRARLELFGGDLLLEPDEVPGPHGSGYQVFTPFYRAWSVGRLPPHEPCAARLQGLALAGDERRRLPTGGAPLPAGPDEARARLVAAITSGIVDRYADQRDVPAVEGTTRLSAYLRFGMCSPGQVGRALRIEDEPSAGGEALWRQLAWREFAHHLMARRPEVLRVAMRPSLRAVAWRDAPGHLAAWKAGETGVPLVDAGMRQLATEGWIHNRVRMVVASYLVKNLLIDWRLGETHFMRHLIDADPANNNAGWQWTAGTGADAAPYFRVFNPVRQGERFDPDGEFVRRWVPELRDVPARRIHAPWTMGDAEQRAAGCRIGSDYPEPLVDLSVSRAAAIAAYRAAEDAAKGSDPGGSRPAGHGSRSG